MSLLVQKAGWLRETGNPEDGAKALDDAARILDRLPRSGHEAEWSLCMEQGVAAQQRGDSKAAEAFLSEARSLARQGAASDPRLPDVLANQASLYLDQGRLSEAQDVGWLI